MKHNQDLVIQWLQEIILRAGKQGETCYKIPYSLISSFDPSDKYAQSDIIDMYLDWPLLSDSIQVFRFDNQTQSVYILWYEPLDKRFPMVNPQYCCIDCEEMPASECWWDGTTQSTGYHDVFFTEVQLLRYVFKYYEKWGYTYWKDNGHYHIREDDNETEYTFEQCFCLVNGQLEIMYRTYGWNWSIIQEEDFKSILECSQSVTLIKKENEDMKDTVIIGRGFKKYSLDNKEDVQSFFKEALCPPMFDDDDKFDKWCEENHIYILAQNGAMELPYDADVLNDLDLILREGHEAIYGSGEASTGNTKGSEYRNATYKDLLKVEVRRIMEKHSVSYPKAIKKAYNMTGIDELLKYMEKNMDCLCDEYQVNFRAFDSLLFHNLFSTSARKEALKNIVCPDIQMGEMIDKDRNHFDIVQLMDCSILPWGYMIGWHYGVSFDIDDEDNRKVIENFKKEVFE